MENLRILETLFQSKLNHETGGIYKERKVEQEILYLGAYYYSTRGAVTKSVRSNIDGNAAGTLSPQKEIAMPVDCIATRYMGLDLSKCVYAAISLTQSYADLGGTIYSSNRFKTNEICKLFDIDVADTVEIGKSLYVIGTGIDGKTRIPISKIATPIFDSGDEFGGPKINIGWEVSLFDLEIKYYAKILDSFLPMIKEHVKSKLNLDLHLIPIHPEWFMKSGANEFNVVLGNVSLWRMLDSIGVIDKEIKDTRETKEAIIKCLEISGVENTITSYPNHKKAIYKLLEKGLRIGKDIYRASIDGNWYKSKMLVMPDKYGKFLNCGELLNLDGCSINTPPEGEEDFSYRLGTGKFDMLTKRPWDGKEKIDGYFYEGSVLKLQELYKGRIVYNSEMVKHPYSVECEVNVKTKTHKYKSINPKECYILELEYTHSRAEDIDYKARKENHHWHVMPNYAGESKEFVTKYQDRAYRKLSQKWDIMNSNLDTRYKHICSSVTKLLNSLDEDNAVVMSSTRVKYMAGLIEKVLPFFGGNSEYQNLENGVWDEMNSWKVNAGWSGVLFAKKYPINGKLVELEDNEVIISQEDLNTIRLISKKNGFNTWEVLNAQISEGSIRRKDIAERDVNLFVAATALYYDKYEWVASIAMNSIAKFNRLNDKIEKLKKLREDMEASGNSNFSLWTVVRYPTIGDISFMSPKIKTDENGNALINGFTKPMIIAAPNLAINWAGDCDDAVHENINATVTTRIPSSWDILEGNIDFKKHMDPGDVTSLTESYVYCAPRWFQGHVGIISNINVRIQVYLYENRDYLPEEFVKWMSNVSISVIGQALQGFVQGVKKLIEDLLKFSPFRYKKLAEYLVEHGKSYFESHKCDPNNPDISEFIIWIEDHQATELKQIQFANSRKQYRKAEEWSIYNYPFSKLICKPTIDGYITLDSWVASFKEIFNDKIDFEAVKLVQHPMMELIPDDDRISMKPIYDMVFKELSNQYKHAGMAHKNLMDVVFYLPLANYFGIVCSKDELKTKVKEHVINNLESIKNDAGLYEVLYKAIYSYAKVAMEAKSRVNAAGVGYFRLIERMNGVLLAIAAYMDIPDNLSQSNELAIEVRGYEDNGINKYIYSSIHGLVSGNAPEDLNYNYSVDTSEVYAIKQALVNNKGLTKLTVYYKSITIYQLFVAKQTNGWFTKVREDFKSIGFYDIEVVFINNTPPIETYKPYAGIGSRETSPDALRLFKEIGAELAKAGFTLRSGHAIGADSAFESGCDKEHGTKEIYIPEVGFNKSSSLLVGVDTLALNLAKEVHPNWNACDYKSRRLHARNCYQILGENLDNESPVKFVICWTKQGLGGGGTGQALRLVKKLKERNLPINIPVYDFGKFQTYNEMLNFWNQIKKGIL